jgi:hypothetical protein
VKRCPVGVDCPAESFYRLVFSHNHGISQNLIRSKTSMIPFAFVLQVGPVNLRYVAKLSDKSPWGICRFRYVEDTGPNPP